MADIKQQVTITSFTIGQKRQVGRLLNDLGHLDGLLEQRVVLFTARKEVVAHYTWEQYSRNIVEKLRERSSKS